MRTRIRKRICLLIALLPFFWGCRDLLAELAHQGEAVEREGMVPVSVVLDGGGASRTIAPGHVTAANLQNYTFELTGSSDMGGTVSIPNFTLANGLGEVLLSPGNWRLRLTATFAGTLALAGGTALTVTDTPTSASITLSPVASGTGTVRIEFTLAEATVSRLDAQQITVALYDSSLNAPVAGTQQVIPVTGGTVATYTANGTQIPVGKYTVRMESPYTIQNASTRDLPVTYKVGWQDVLYVEADRESTASVTVASAVGAMGVPNNPNRKDKATVNSRNQNIRGINFREYTEFSPFGECLWLYGADFNGDGNGNDADGNEWLVVDWDPVYNADHYELEILVHPFTAVSTSPTSPGGRFDTIVWTDAAWDALSRKPFDYGVMSSTPIYLRFSGAEDDPDYYRSRIYDIQCLTNGTSSATVGRFLSCADKAVARSMFTTGGYGTGFVNSGYIMRAAQDVFDTYGTYVYGGVNRGKVGLEADCGVLAVLLPAFAPQMSLVYRVRGVNRFGYSDWVYWKGGKWGG